MKRLITLVSLLALVFGADPVLAQFSQNQRAELRDINMLSYSNPGFEQGKAYWTASGGTFAITTTAANVGAGTTSGSWDASGAQTFKSATIAIPSGLYGSLCRASIMYKGGDSNLTLQVIDATPTVLYTKALTASTNFTKVGIDFICPTSGSLALRISAGADAAIAYFDQAFLGGTGPAYVDGTPEINMIRNPSAKYNSFDWYSTGAGVTVARTTTSTDLPLGDAQLTAIKVTPVSGTTDYAYTRWTLPAALQNRKLKVQWEQRPLAGYASGDLKADVYCDDDSAYGSPTRMALSTDASAVTGVPSSTGRFVTTFDADSTNIYCELRFTRTAGTTAINFANVLAGPGVAVQGAAVGPWTSYTPTTAALGTVTSMVARYRRVGEVMEIEATWTNGTTDSGTAVKFSLPTGFTGNVSVNQMLKGIVGTDYTGSTTGQWFPIMTAADTSNIQFGNNMSRSGFNPITGGGFVTGPMSLVVSVPIAQWVGSGVVNVVQNDVEYGYNTSGLTTAGGSDTTAFGYGPAGAAIGSIASTTTTGNSTTGMRVRFKSVISATDSLVVEVDGGTSGAQWLQIGSSYQIAPGTWQGTATYGVGFSIANSTDVDVNFGNAGIRPSSTYGASGTAWSAAGTWRWRVRKISGGQAVGFSNVSQTSAGLVKSSGQLLGTNTNDDPTAGNVGEYLENLFSNQVAAATGTFKSFGTITLTAGDWDVSGIALLDAGGATVVAGNNQEMCISIVSDSCSGTVIGDSLFYFNAPNTSGQPETVSIPQLRFKVAAGSTLPVYINGLVTYSAGTPHWYGNIKARRRR